MVTIIITWWRVDVGDPFPVSEHRVASDRCCLHLRSRCPWRWWGWRHWRWHAADDIFIKHQRHLLSWSGDIQRDRNPRDENRSVLGARVDSHVHRRVGKAWMDVDIFLGLCDVLYFCDDGGGDDDEDDNYQHYDDDDQTDLLWVYETLYERRVSQEVWSGSSRQHTVTPGDQNSLRLSNMEMRREEAFFAFFGTITLILANIQPCRMFSYSVWRLSAWWDGWHISKTIAQLHIFNPITHSCDIWWPRKTFSPSKGCLMANSTMSRKLRDLSHLGIVKQL